MQFIVRRASGNGAYTYTRNQVLSAWIARMRPKMTGLKWLGRLALLIGSGAFVVPDVWPLPWIGAAGVAALLLSATRARFSLKDGERCLRRWERSQEPMDGYIKSPRLKKPPPTWNESDILDYGVEAILVVDDPVLVDFFVLNNAHADQRMLVVSQTGYPSYVLPLAQRILAEQPDVPLCFLHGSGSSAAELARELSKHLRFAGGIRDLGWSYEEAMRFARIRGTELEDAKDIPIDWLPAKRLLGAVGAAIASRQRAVDALGVSDGEREMHFG